MADCKDAQRLIERLQAYHDALVMDLRMSSAAIARLIRETMDRIVELENLVADLGGLPEETSEDDP